MEDKEIIRELVRHAVSTLPADPERRALILEAAALLLDGDEAEQASSAAAHIRAAQQAQLRLNFSLSL